MVAVIKYSESLHNLVNYNENKVKEGVAECIGAANYPKDLEDLTFNNKINRLTMQAALNKGVELNGIHISLNFHPREVLSINKMNNIANVYMEKLGLDDLPYLVYQHHDAGHPHLHIVAVKVRANGNYIDMHNYGKNESSKAREEIERDFGLIKARGRGQDQGYQLQPINAQKVLYGRTPTKRAMTSVLEEVIDNYKFTSLSEFNAVLSCYNVYADGGSKDSRVFKNRGLLYRILDENGNKVGVPIKASDFYNRPTLKKIEELYEDNKAARAHYKTGIRNAVDLYFTGKRNLTLEGLRAGLQQQGISVVYRRNDSGLIYGVTFVDHQKKCVFNGRELGPAYGIKGLKDRCDPAVDQLLSGKATGQQRYGAGSGKSQYTGQLPKAYAKKPRMKYSFEQVPNVMPPFSKLNGYTAMGQPHHSPHSASYPGKGLLTLVLEPIDDGSQLPPELQASRYKKKGRRKKHN